MRHRSAAGPAVAANVGTRPASRPWRLLTADGAPSSPGGHCVIRAPSQVRCPSVKAACHPRAKRFANREPVPVCERHSRPTCSVTGTPGEQSAAMRLQRMPVASEPTAESGTSMVTNVDP